LEKQRQEKEQQAEETARQIALMRCPKCGTALDSRRMRGVNIEHCPKCDGIWLDRGELDAIAGSEPEAEGWIARWLRTK
jgi:ssDNA-binding Zn-finger/Zn-ribbon topoisomerase 1